MELTMTVATWIALAALLVTVVINIRTNSKHTGQEEQKLKELSERAEEDRVHNEKKIELLESRLAEQEKARAVQMTQYESIRADIVRMGNEQQKQGEKLDNIAQSLATITEALKHGNSYDDTRR